MTISFEEVKQKSIEIQEELREYGYTLDVTHNRIMNGFAAIDPDTNEYDSCLSREEFAKAVYNHSYRANFYRDDDTLKFGNFVSPTGGFTRVKLTKDDGTVLVGKYNFGPKEQFFKANGVLRAIGRALKTQRKSQND